MAAEAQVPVGFLHRPMDLASHQQSSTYSLEMIILILGEIVDLKVLLDIMI